MKQRGIAFILGAMAATLFACSEKTTDPPPNQPPVIIGIGAQPDVVTYGGLSQASVTIQTDPDPVTYHWSADLGSFANPSSRISTWTAPDSAGTFALTVWVSDGSDSTQGSVDVTVGNVSVTVESDPPDALITLDGGFTGERTPHTFDPLPPGLHQVVVFNPDFAYSTDRGNIDLTHGQSDTLRFSTDPARFVDVNLGRDDFLEIAGVSFLPGGNGFLYSARTVGGTGIFNSALNPPTGTPHGFILVRNVRLEEPISVSADGAYVFYVTESESLMAAEIQDTQGDGLVDAVLAIHPQRRNSYGPSISTEDNVAFTLTRSEDPPTVKILSSKFENNVLDPSPALITTLNGRLPNWRPGGSFLTFEFNGTLFTNFVSPDDVFAADSLTAGNFDTAPAWGSWGPEHVAYLHGSDEFTLDEVRLALRGSPYQVTVHTGLGDPRYIAWSPTQEALVVTHNPAGKGAVRFLFGLPIP